MDLSSDQRASGTWSEAKLLVLRHAFETWRVLCICFHTDAQPTFARSLERIGGKIEGILRSHRMAAEHTARDSVRYSIMVAEWPDVRQRLASLLDHCRPVRRGPDGRRWKSG